MTVEYNNDTMLAHQRAELGRATWWHAGTIVSQALIALLAAISVYYNDGRTLLLIGGLIVVAVVAWVFAGIRYRTHRGLGDQARRIVLIGSGLGHSFAPSHLRDVTSDFGVPLAGRSATTVAEYFATTAAPGPRRLAEMIEESAYWTGDLQRWSFAAMRASLITIVITPLIAWASLFSGAEEEAQISIARVLLALFVFVLSSDLVGAMYGHKDAGKVMALMLRRLETTKARDYPPCEVLLLMSDYNAAVEAAPMPLPGSYEMRSPDLGNRWRAYFAAMTSEG